MGIEMGEGRWEEEEEKMRAYEERRRGGRSNKRAGEKGKNKVEKMGYWEGGRGDEGEKEEKDDD